MATVNLGRIKFVWQGAYNGATAYVADDVVSYNGSSYICILASTGNLPTNTTYWNLMAQSGTDITSLAGLAQGDVLYYNGTSWVRLGAGTSGQFLKTNGTGANPAWATVTSSILQVKFVEKTGTQSWASTAETEITDLNVSITPTSASNKILVLGQLWTSADTSALTAYNALKRSIGGGGYSTLGNHTNDGTDNSKATGHGGVLSGAWNLMNTSISFLDNPATTSAINYKWYAQNEASGTTFWVNRTARNSTIYHPRASSTITLMEISSGVL
jgi:hypothetical protein